ncbi:DUF4145 domain-containing protein [Leptolyngbya sp. CCNP1308]|uniref:DUF4145 domain-containing protein n=1 Tax=Leptolyngbya sp. CCNP1308 TaxID=3110255 RepID=UPI002B1F3FC4|nr:DUF4145 domain-containing protein [Leptolyngbya sp. CCNP1308]MEA5451242.1 DUF4145 domain-containing protein [Leptolyngbya sp. CCNP1308]
MFEHEIGREFCNCGSLMICETDFKHRVDYGESGEYCLEIFNLYKCPACHEITLICYYSPGNENLDEDYQDTPEWKLYRGYKRSVLHAPFKRLHPAIPQAIADVVNQAQAVLFKSPRASFILCRAALEEICNDFGIPEKSVNSKGREHFINLQDRLSQLFKKEKMSDDLFAVIQGIRELGNEGAHSAHCTFSRTVKSQDAENLLDLIHYVAERLYVDKCRQEEAVERLNKLKEKILPLDA